MLPFQDRIDHLPGPQRDAASTAFGLRPGATPDQFVLGLAVLTLLSELAEERPLVCLVDDSQWLDHASSQTLQFVARRLAAEPVALVFAARDAAGESRLTGLPELRLHGLSHPDAAALLDSVVPGVLDTRVRARILAESNGNPLALMELPRALTPTELALGTTLRARSTDALADRLEQSYLRQLEPLSTAARQLLLIAAAEPVGDVQLLWQAAAFRGLAPDIAAEVEATRMVEISDLVRFRHPLVRSALYRSATPSGRRSVHQALAEATDPDLDPDRRAWHRARGAVAPDESIAAELERSAGRVAALGGLSAAAAFLESAAALMPDRVRRAQRSLDAAQAKATAGAFSGASWLLAVAEAGPVDEAGLARIDLLRAQIAYNSVHGNDALPLMLSAARRLEPLDGRMARETYLDALSAALFAGRLAPGTGLGMRQVAEAARRAPQPREPAKADLLLQGMALLYTDGYAASAPVLHRAVEAFGREELTVEEAFRSAWVAAVAAVDLWDDVHWGVLSQRHLDVVRKSGALSLLPLALASRAIFDIHRGDLSAAASLVAESHWVAEITGGENTFTPLPEAWLATLRGDEKVAERLIQDNLNDATARGQGVGLNMMYAARAVLYNGLGRYEDALAAAREAIVEPLELGPTKWALAEAVEAGVRSGNLDAAVETFDVLSAMTRASGTDLALGIETLSAMGAQAFAERARRELAATGERLRTRVVDTQGELTPQEAHIVRLAAEGLTNPEIAAALFVSPRTVEWHLRHVFDKLGIHTRRDLRRHR